MLNFCWALNKEIVSSKSASEQIQKKIGITKILNFSLPHKKKENSELKKMIINPKIQKIGIIQTIIVDINCSCFFKFRFARKGIIADGVEIIKIFVIKIIIPTV